MAPGRILALCDRPSLIAECTSFLAPHREAQFQGPVQEEVWQEVVLEEQVRLR